MADRRCEERRMDMKKGFLRRPLVLLGLATSLILCFGVSGEEKMPSTEKREYVISVEDILEVHVWKEPELSREVKVREDGKISLPLVDDIQADGRTPVELKKAIAEKLSEFLVHPQVSVIVKSPRKYKVYVTGNVNKPGIYESLTPITPLQAIAMAGGLNEWASSKLIILSQEKGEQTRRVINYKEVISGESLDQNRPLKSGDTVIAP
jgi:polysaccharide export outer membrane protein